MSFVDGLVDCEFGAFLVSKLQLQANETPRKGEWSRMGNTIGALALRLNLLTDAQVNEVLQTQDVEGGFFGELAVRARFLTAEQVDSVLRIQQMHDQLQIGEQLVAAGRLEVRELINTMAEFLATRSVRSRE